MVKKILFLNGPSQDPSDRFFGWPTSLLYAVSPAVHSIKEGRLHLTYDTSVFEPLWYVDGTNDEQVKEEFRERIADADIICASAIYDSLYPTLQLLMQAKKLKPTITTILGGPHIDETHNLAAYTLPNTVVDFIIAGDGEHALLEVLHAIAKDDLSHIDLASIPGQAWIYHAGKCRRTTGGPLVLDDLPFIPLELVDEKQHRNDFDIFRDEWGNILPTFQMIAMRGCPYVCNFCSERRDLAYPNAKSIDTIIEEIEYRKAQGFKAVLFDDSTFGAYKSRQGTIKDLLSALSTTGMTFGSLNRFNHLLNPEQIEQYVDAGFSYFYCSIEQFDDSALKQMSKGQVKKQLETSISLLSKYNLKLGVSLLYGLPYETDTSISATLDFTQQWVKNKTIALVSESVLSYHPGTPIGKGKVLDFNRPPPNSGYPFNHFEEGQWYHPEHVTAEYLERILRLSEERFKDVMVRHRHSWHVEHGHVLETVD